jgi:predicted RNase H-like HicB family nuclease
MATSKTSKSASASAKKRAAAAAGREGGRGRIDRPFDPAILKRAREIVAHYQVVIRLEEDGYYGRGLELPNALGDGDTPAQCLESTKESMTAVVAFMLERGEQPPPAASDEAKLVQLNVRISAGEKVMFEEAARQRGQGLSEFIRSAAVERAKAG